MNTPPTEHDDAKQGQTSEQATDGFWSVGIWCPADADARPPKRDPLGGIERCVANLTNAGLSDLRLFVEPSTVVPVGCSHLPITIVPAQFRGPAVLRSLLAELFMRRPDAGAVLFLSADAETSGVANWCQTVAARWQQSTPPALVIDGEHSPGMHALTESAIREFLTDPSDLTKTTAAPDADITSVLRNWAQRTGAAMEVIPRVATLQQPAAAGRAEANGKPETRDRALTPDRSLQVSGAAVSIVVPSWNCADYLPACLQSLLRQTVAAEVIVVDDASSDETPHLLEQFTDRVTVIRHDHQRGANAARNTGITAASGDLIAFADADNEYAPRWIERLLQSVLADPSAALAFCGYTKQFADGERLENRAAPWDLETLWYGNYIDMSSLVRRSAIPDGKLSEGFRPFDDWRLWLQLARAGWRGAWRPENLFVKHIRESSKTEQSLAVPHQRGKEIAHLRREYADLVGWSDPISVVIPAVGCEDLTARCLQHLGDYCGVPFDVLYVDNGSQVSVLDVVAAAADAADVPLRIIRNRQNQGFTRAVNQGIDASAGADVLVLNNDCFIGPGCVENLARELRFDERVAAAGPLSGDGGGQSLRDQQWRDRVGFPEEALGELDDPVRISFRLSHKLRSATRPVLAFFCALLSREALRRYGPLDEQFTSGLAADDEWCLRVGRQGREVRVVLNAYAAHLHHSSFERLQLDRDALQRDAQDRLHQILGHRA